MGPSGLQSHVPLYRGRTYVQVWVLVGYSHMYHYTGDGPMYPQAIPGADKCKDDWWRHIVYVNNVVGTHGNDAFNQVMYGS